MFVLKGDFYHGQPEVYHSLNNYPGTMKPGMVFTIEPGKVIYIHASNICHQYSS